MRGLLDEACSIGENAGASCSEDVLIKTVPGCIKFGPKQCWISGKGVLTWVLGCEEVHWRFCC